jgi:ABC-type Mn2+/Zn2+ transport system permease subunit
VTLFDSAFAKVMGQKTLLLDAIMLFMTALTIVGGFQSVGVVIIMAFFTLPVLIARLFGPFLKRILLIGSCVTFVSALVSVAIARDILTYYATSVSTSAVAALFLFFCYIVLGLTYFKKVGKLEHS